MLKSSLKQIWSRVSSIFDFAGLYLSLSMRQLAMPVGVPPVDPHFDSRTFSYRPGVFQFKKAAKNIWLQPQA